MNVTNDNKSKPKYLIMKSEKGHYLLVIDKVFYSYDEALDFQNYILGRK